MTNPERCSCGAREKNKCSKENGYNTGKICLKGYVPIPQELFDRMEVIREKAEENRLKELKAEQTIQEWTEEFVKNQEPLEVEFAQILADNISDLYER